MIQYLCILQNDHHNTSITIHSYKIVFLVMRTFKIYFISDFQICNTVLLTIVTTLYILIIPHHQFSIENKSGYDVKKKKNTINKGCFSTISKTILRLSQLLCLMLNLKYSVHYLGHLCSFSYPKLYTIWLLLPL